MTTKDFTANVISASKVVPDGNFKDSKASGVWDINEALDLIKGGNWPNVANINPAAFVDALFQCHLYTGTGSDQTITNGIDLSGKGGMVWIKGRNAESNHALIDTERGGANSIASDTTAAQRTDGAYGLTFNSTGFISTGGNLNVNNREQVSWTFRKQPKFFDIISYTGNGSTQSISHNLNSEVGMMLIKETGEASNWFVYHRSLSNDAYLILQTTAAKSDLTDYITAGTSTIDLINNSSNTSGRTYVAYIFAHNNNDGGFGEPGDQDIIKCGSYTGNAGNPQLIELGFEPQFLMVKCTSNSGDWFVVDNMRGVLPNADYGDANRTIYWNKSDAEIASGNFGFYSTGFAAAQSSSTNGSGRNFIYMAIRRGGMQTPTVASSVFSIDTFDNSGDPKYDSTHVVDMSLIKLTDDTGDWFNYARPMGFKYLSTNDDGAEANASEAHFDHMRGFSSSDWGNNDYQAWMWARARGYFDVVAYSGTGSGAQNVSHNLGVVPEMMWIKVRSDQDNWTVYHSALGNTKRLLLNNSGAESSANSMFFNNTTPTSSVFTAGTLMNASHTYIAYLFATVAGVSKIGSYTGSGSDQTIDCGFTNGAKFVLIKVTSDADNWVLFDTTRGLVAGNDTLLSLNLTHAQVTNTDYIDPQSSGFAVPGNDLATNKSSETYIFYAIANDPS